MSMKKPIICLISILAIGAALRFYGIFNRGIFIADETVYYRAAVAGKAGIEKCLKGHGGNILAVMLPVVDSFAGKPTHILLGVGGFFVFGMRQCAPLIVMGIFGCFTIWVVFLIGRMMRDAGTGLLAAALLSVSAVHIYYSRSFMPHADQTFFVTLAAFFYLKQYMRKSLTGRSLAPVGLLMGTAFTIHPVTLFYAPLFILLELAAWIYKRPFCFKRLLARMTWFLGSFFLPAFLLVLVSIFGRSEAAPLLTFADKGYLGQVIFRDSADAVQNGLIDNRNLGKWHMLLLSGVYNGWIFACCMIAASAYYLFVHVIKKRSFIAAAICALSLGAMAYWQYFAQHARIFRLILSAYPIFCVVIAVFVCEALPKKLAKALIALLLIEGLCYSGNVVRQVKSEFPALEKFLNAESPKAILTTSSYIPTTADVIMPGLVNPVFFCVSDFGEAKKRALTPESTYLIVAPSDWLGNETFRFTAEPKMTIPDPFLFYFPTFYETARVGGYMDRLAHKDNISARKIAVFVMSDLLEEKKTEAAR